MSNFKATFSLTTDRDDCLVFLLLKDQFPKEMTLKKKVLRMGTIIFETDIEFRGIDRFPMETTYNYTIDGAQVFDDDRQLIVNRAPAHENLFVNDTIAQRVPRSETISVNFNLFYPAKEGEIMTIRSNNKVFETDPGDYVCMTSKQGMWRATVPVSCYAIQPLVYKFYLVEHTGKIIRSEEGRPHTLFVHAPVGGVCVCVYDMWNQMMFGYPYVSRPLYPCTVQKGTVSFSMEYVPQQPVDMVYAQGSCPSLTSETGIEMTKDVAWRLRKNIPATEIGFKFQLGNVMNAGNSPPSWISGPYACVHPMQVAPEAIRTRLLWGVPARRWFCVYAPLVSLRINDSQLVGDFGTLVVFAMWAKRCGIGQIHVHVEKLANNLIDPIHAQVPLKGDIQELSIDAVRTLKIQGLWERYTDYKRKGIDYRFEKFKCQYPWVGQYCQNEFAHWIQSVLFQQMSSAYERIVDIGVQLVTDFSPAGTAIQDQIITFSQFTSVLRLVNFDFLVQGLSPPTAEKIVGAEHFQQILGFCNVTGNTIKVNPALANPRNVAAALAEFDPAVAREIGPKLEHLACLSLLAEPRGCTEMLSQLTLRAPCALVADIALTRVFGPKAILERFGMIPSSPEPTPGMSALAPELISPEMVSQFGQDATPDSILAEFTRTAQSSAESVTVYLHDLLAALSGKQRSAPNSLRTTPGHCRFQFPATLEMMQLDEETNRKIAQFLNSSSRHI